MNLLTIFVSGERHIRLCEPYVPAWIQADDTDFQDAVICCFLRSGVSKQNLQNLNQLLDEYFPCGASICHYIDAGGEGVQFLFISCVYDIA